VHARGADGNRQRAEGQSERRPDACAHARIQRADSGQDGEGHEAARQVVGCGRPRIGLDVVLVDDVHGDRGERRDHAAVLGADERSGASQNGAQAGARCGRFVEGGRERM
jgi:hypothetical protein